MSIRVVVTYKTRNKALYALLVIVRLEYSKGLLYPGVNGGGLVIYFLNKLCTKVLNIRDYKSSII